MKKSAQSVSIIGGADGPTSIFLVGSKYKDKNIFRRIKQEFLNRKFKKKRKFAEKSIVPDGHTLEETIQYMKQHYAAVEADSSYPYYEKCKSSMKYALIQREKPELLGENVEIPPPEDFSDVQAVKEWQRLLTEQISQYERKVDMISDVVYPTDYHLFLISNGENETMEIEVDMLYPGISISYCGAKEVMEPILKDIHLYYGVSQEDIEQKTDRYKSLVNVLSFY